MTGLDVSAPPVPRSEEVLTPEALAFVADLDARFHERRDELLAARRSRREEIARTGRLDFLPGTAEVRDSDWTVAPVPADLRDRRVEITGPTDPKMAINALNSGARVWLADLEDANTPHWRNVVGGQLTLRDAVRGRLAFTSPEGKEYAVADPASTPVILPRPRGWHFDEAHLTADGRPVVAALVDFGLHFFHNARELLAAGSGPYYYLPKLESHLEARLWNDVFTHAEAALGVPHGSVRATVLIETITAAFEMDEILYELRDHAAGLNAGRWDYLFSIIKNFRDAGPGFTLPDRNAVTMAAPMMTAYSDLLVRTCHRRGAFAIGGMAAFIPSRRDPEVNERAFAKVREDKTREARAGFDGSWVAHPDLVPLCEEVFDAVLDGRDNQLDVLRDDVAVSAADLLAVGETPGERTEAGLRGNVRIGMQYLHAWLSGNGAAGIDNLMEDAATAEISRSQVWQWVYNEATLDTGEVVTRELVERLVAEEHEALGGAVDDDARRLFVDCALGEDFPDFLTLQAYDVLLARGTDRPSDRPDETARGHLVATDPDVGDVGVTGEREHLAESLLRRPGVPQTDVERGADRRPHADRVELLARAQVARHVTEAHRRRPRRGAEVQQVPRGQRQPVGAEQVLQEVGLQALLEDREPGARTDVAAECDAHARRDVAPQREHPASRGRRCSSGSRPPRCPGPPSTSSSASVGCTLCASTEQPPSRPWWS